MKMPQSKSQPKEKLDVTISTEYRNTGEIKTYRRHAKACMPHLQGLHGCKHGLMHMHV